VLLPDDDITRALPVCDTLHRVSRLLLFGLFHTHSLSPPRVRLSSNGIPSSRHCLPRPSAPYHRCALYTVTGASPAQLAAHMALLNLTPAHPDASLPTDYQWPAALVTLRFAARSPFGGDLFVTVSSGMAAAEGADGRGDEDEEDAGTDSTGPDVDLLLPGRTAGVARAPVLRSGNDAVWQGPTMADNPFLPVCGEMALRKCVAAEKKKTLVEGNIKMAGGGKGVKGRRENSSRAPRCT